MKSTNLICFLQGNLIAINVGTAKSSITRPGETDILMFNIETGNVSMRVELSSRIADLARSKCRFLACDGRKVYVSDLGRVISSYFDQSVCWIGSS